MTPNPPARSAEPLAYCTDRERSGSATLRAIVLLGMTLGAMRIAYVGIVVWQRVSPSSFRSTGSIWRGDPRDFAVEMTTFSLSTIGGIFYLMGGVRMFGQGRGSRLLLTGAIVSLLSAIFHAAAHLTRVRSGFYTPGDVAVSSFWSIKYFVEVVILPIALIVAVREELGSRRP